MKKLSIISVNYNNYNGLIQTLESVKRLDYHPYEHWVIDGASTDMDLDFDSLHKQYVFSHVSESDSGIYNAMNKGILRSTGTHILFLNSGDAFADSKSCSVLLEKHFEQDIFYANVWQVDGESLTASDFPASLDLEYMICFGLPHQATIIKKSLFEKAGIYAEQYKIISDWVFFMEAIFYHGATYGMIDVPVVLFDRTGVSSQHQHTRNIIIEQLDYITKRFPKYISFYKENSPYVKKYFRRIPRWKRPFSRLLFNLFNKL